MTERELVKYGYRHTYRIKFVYKDKSGKAIFDITSSISFSSQILFNDFRKIKKAVIKDGKDFFVKNTKKYLCNGFIEVEPICYLGFYKSQGTKCNLSYSSIPKFKKS